MGFGYAARIGDAWFDNPHKHIGTIERQVVPHNRPFEEARKPFSEEFPVTREILVVPTRRESVRVAKPHRAAKFAAYHESATTAPCRRAATISG